MKIGNKWSKEFSKDYAITQKKALEKRNMFNETDSGSVKFPVNEFTCRYSGFSELEVNDFIDREVEYGTLNNV